MTEWSHARVKGRLPEHLGRCPGCGQFIFRDAKKCPHCGGTIVTLQKKQLAALRKAQKAMDRLNRALGIGL